MQEIFLSRQYNNFNLCEQKAPQNEVDDKTDKQMKLQEKEFSSFAC